MSWDCNTSQSIFNAGMSFRCTDCVVVGFFWVDHYAFQYCSWCWFRSHYLFFSLLFSSLYSSFLLFFRSLIFATHCMWFLFFSPAFFSVNAHRKNAIKYTPDGFGTYVFFFIRILFLFQIIESAGDQREIQTTVQCAWTLIKVCVRIFWQKHIFSLSLVAANLFIIASHECEPQHCSVHSSNNSTPVMIFSRRFV